jgi:hypothetical protein
MLYDDDEENPDYSTILNRSRRCMSHSIGRSFRGSIGVGVRIGFRSFVGG